MYTSKKKLYQVIMMEKTQSVETKFWQDLIQVSDMMRIHTTPAELAKWGDVTIRQIKIMKTVWTLQNENPNGITLKRLAQDLNLSSATMSESVETLVRKNMLQRQQNPLDRREVLITLSQYSEALFKETVHLMDALSARILADLTEQEKVFFIETMSKIFDKLKTTGKESVQ